MFIIMKSKDLKVLSIIELRRLAKQLKVSLKRTMTKQHLIKAIVLSTRSRAISATLKGKKQNKVKSLHPRPQPHAAIKHGAAKLQPEEVLPVYNGISKLVLMPRDPWWIFVYWEVDRSLVAGKSLILRVYRQSDRLYASINVGNSNNWYINLPEPADTVRSELGYIKPGGEFRIVAVSNTVKTPRAWPSDISYTGAGNKSMDQQTNPFIESYTAYERVTPYVRENITSRKR
jgi:hypothetical protein